MGMAFFNARRVAATAATPVEPEIAKEEVDIDGKEEEVRDNQEEVKHGKPGRPRKEK